MVLYLDSPRLRREYVPKLDARELVSKHEHCSAAKMGAPQQMHKRTHGVSRAQSSGPLCFEPQYLDQRNGMSCPPKMETSISPDYSAPPQVASFR